MNNIIKNNYGSTILLITLLILSSILVVSLAAAEIVKKGLIMGRTQIYSTKSFFAAEAGSERVLWETRKNSFDPANPGCNQDDYVHFDLSPAHCNASEYSVLLSNNASSTVFYISDSNPTVFHSYGSYKNIQRRIEIKY